MHHSSCIPIHCTHPMPPVSWDLNGRSPLHPSVQHRLQKACIGRSGVTRRHCTILSQASKVDGCEVLVTPAGLQDSNHKANLSQYNLPWLLQMYKHPSVGLLERLCQAGNQRHDKNCLAGLLLSMTRHALQLTPSCCLHS